MAVPKPRNYYTQPEFVNVNGLSTACRRKGRGEPVLFLHGAGSTRMILKKSVMPTMKPLRSPS